MPPVCGQVESGKKGASFIKCLSEQQEKGIGIKIVNVAPLPVLKKKSISRAKWPSAKDINI